MTYLEVIDTAVKVGLGALISGLSTYWVTKSKGRDDLHRERLKRHYDLLEKAAQEIDRFSTAALNYLTMAVEWPLYVEANRDWYGEKEADYDNVDKELNAGFIDLRAAESKLLLLGHPETATILATYRDTVNRITAGAFRALLEKTISNEDLATWRKEFHDARRNLFDALSCIYRAQ